KIIQNRKMFQKLFGTAPQPEQKPPEPKKFNQLSKEELAQVQKDFKKKLQKEVREIEKEIFKIEFQGKQSQQNLVKEIKKGEKGDKFIKQTYAKQVLQTQKQKERYLNNKAKVMSLQYSLDNFFAQIKFAQTMQQTGSIMKQINQCMNIKELAVGMADMQKEMLKMGLTEEMMNDAMEAADDNMELENEQEVDNIINQIEQQVKQPGNKNINVQPQQQQSQEQLDDDFDAQLAALKN
ncbi:snf7 family protein, putative, partial [Ichthyophthirius multifiliis]